MASPTPNKNMTYPSHGGAVGAWDTPLNTNFDQLDLNLGGAYPITILTTAVGATYNTSYAAISSTVATVTLPTSLAQNLYYNFTGTQTQNVVLTYPAVGSIYVVGNNSSGAFSLNVSIGSTITAAVTQGGQSIVITNSSGAYLAQNVFSDITVNSLTANSYIKTATGATASRPATPSVGMIYGNTSFKQPEYYDGNNWRQLPVGQPIAAGYRNLKITNTTAASPDTQVVLTADAVTAESTAGTAYRLQNVNVTISSSITGANGLDAGGLANATWYAVYTIYSSSSNTTAGLLSAQFSSSSVAMPAGYDAQARFGSMVTTNSAHFQRIIQYGNTAQYVVTAGSTTINYPILISGDSGDLTTPTWTSVAWGTAAPQTSGALDVLVGAHGTLASPWGVMANPNNAVGAYNNSTNPPQLCVVHGVAGGITVHEQSKARFIIESSNIYYASDLGGQEAFMAITGWVDNI